MEPQPQMQPINPVEGRPFAEPPRPLDLQPKRQPLDLRPRPNYQPLNVPDLRPATADELRPSMNPLDRTNRQGVAESVGRVVNNPIGYTPGKALTFPLAVADRSAELHDELTQPNPMQTLDIPSIPLPDDSFPDLETSPTTQLSPEAIDSGPIIEEGNPNPSGGPGSRSIPYLIRWKCPITVTYSTGESLTAGFTAEQTLGVRTGPLSLQRAGNPQMVYLIHAAGADLLSAGDAIKTYERWHSPTQTYITVTETLTASPSFTATPVDGSTDPEVEPPRAPVRAPNPARRPAPFLDPDFLDAPDSIDAPGFEASPALLPPPAPTGEIVPYMPPAWEPPDRVPYTPPEKQPFPTPPTIPDLEQDPQRPPQDEGDSKKLAPPWWQAWRNFEPPSPWTNKKRRTNWPEEDPGTLTPDPNNHPPVRNVPSDGCCIETLALLQDIQRRLRDLEIDAEVPSWRCDTEGETPTPVREINKATDLSEAINLLGQGIADLQQQFEICPPPPIEQENPSEIARGQATEGETVWYIPLPPLVRQVELIITGTIPQSFRLYETTASGEQQAKFGAMSLSCSGVTGGYTANAFHQWCWTRRTSLYIGDRAPRENFLRVYVRSGLSWILYDTGLRQ